MEAIATCTAIISGKVGGIGLSKTTENTGFTCEHCGREVQPLTNGSYRNHCPFCLHSKHLDKRPGDRASVCGGIMKPVDLSYHSKKGYQIVHICQRCGHEQLNKTAEDEEQSDDVIALMARLAKG
ncbi:RNHCP domain-containing protein [Salicibibacter cibi]|uniref:RNHCP domain-containing protein n=1 Tax=Salicibibacter cibi TaxID=2743001 RepID=A0A7T6ZE44_9BACI|nr:RNHCP domain-containing protein [Salicibibacter cibi]